MAYSTVYLQQWTPSSTFFGIMYTTFRERGLYGPFTPVPMVLAFLFDNGISHEGNKWKCKDDTRGLEVVLGVGWPGDCFVLLKDNLN